ncbi:hypothetical protein IAQ67_15490 [Paenibacillus peoriae]|uniref:Uncharacterized protein n=1 Tax=Paenibacillus peoriae TaxID=59893 RepID=A0A7H0Y2J4_9BACL|nr:hypothetical protein [Paenibacillus peoriae]QNR65302.1 hypothetical protein IAQ67_15490 [Paenibacillus peoriae]
MNVNNDLARQTFFQNYKNESINIELERITNALRNNTMHPKGVEFLKKSSLIKDLERDSLIFSNDTTCDLIVHTVYNYTKNKKLKETINNIYVGFVETKDENPHVNDPFFDGSRLIIIDAKTSFILDQIGEIIAIKYMSSHGYFNSLNEKFDREILQRCIQKQLNPYSKDLLYEFEDLILKNGGEKLVDNFAELISKITETSIGFVVGHEIGHCLLNHTGYTNNVNVDHNMEIQADECGVFLVRDYLRSYDLDLSQKHLDLQICGVASSIISMALSSGSPLLDGRSHPSIRKRYGSVIFSIQRLFGKVFAQEANKMVDWFCAESGYHQWREIWWTLPSNYFDEIEKLIPELEKNAE